MCIMKINLFKPKFKIEMCMIQFTFHNIHISDQAQFFMINMSLKLHHINICEN